MKISKRISVVFLFSEIITTLMYIAVYVWKIQGISFRELYTNKGYLSDIIAIFIINMLAHIIIALFVNKIITKKVRSIEIQISSINKNSDVKGRIEDVSGNDVFSELAKDINSMFQSIEDQNNTIISNEKKYSRLVDGLDNGYAYLKMLRDEEGNAKDAFIVETNTSLGKMLNMSKSDLIAGSFIKIFTPFIKDSEIVPKILKTMGAKNQSVFRNSVRLGVDKWAYLTVYPIENEFFALIFTDISENKRFAEEMKHIANYDVLTGIQNRFSLYNYMEELKNNDKDFCIYYIDLDRFKQINDTLGHNVGDEVLCRTAETVQNMGGDSFNLGRLGGDEFLGIREGVYTIEEIEAFGNEIIRNLNAVESYNGYPYKIEASLGASRFKVDSSDIEGLLKCGDIALYKSKKSGRNKIKVFDAEMRKEAKFQSEIKNAIQNGDLEVYFQPVLNVKEDKICSAEALMRWNKFGEIVEPKDFVESAKESDDIIDIDKLAFEESCKLCGEKRQQGIDDYKVAFNASIKFLKQKNLIEYIKENLKKYNVTPSSIKIEITEKEMGNDYNKILPILKECKNFGMEIALDDFGVGQSTFSFLKTFPIDTIKLDRELLKKMEVDKKTLAVISALINLAHNLSLEVVVEGVENQEQFRLLKDLQCDYMQGYAICKALPKNEFLKKY
ncbi:bifunctional diguanylate cyclase/phosphodiesterase [Clostridium sp. MSJ-8]|uniref:bifunctional diguanylate cyclase/phosphodiesterase n=1 Tax=Clostridium sp. MSJ-8 TaxID=2841510 RepID=UPI001C0E94EE|nr:bifunctional diguanylate cyclase/phosphodiesterase [Clostridium sp. MSJ-8]MBU5487779.1 bifunctional diguanylate cyclase/phosphodiesterase [Clostridium sp. MSJ-8]